MRVIIPAAGVGTRLRPHTETQPKALVEVEGMPLLWHTLGELREAAVSEVVVVCGYLSEKLRASVDACPKRPPVRFIENPRYAETNSIVSVAATRSFWEEPFCLIDGDVLVGPGLLGRLLAEQGDALAVDTGKAYADIDMKVRVENGRATDFGKDLAPAPGLGEFFGVSRWSPEGAADFSAMIDKLLAGGGEGQWYEMAIREVALDHGLGVLPATSDEWAEVDAAEDLPAARALIRRNQGNGTLERDALE